MGIISLHGKPVQLGKVSFATVHSVQAKATFAEWLLLTTVNGTHHGYY
jgi:hypothetical protein